MKPFTYAWPVALVAAAAAPAHAQSARDLLTQASFHDGDEATALRRVAVAERLAAGRLRSAPDDREAALMHATALGYRAKLTGSRSDAVAARREMEALVARAPQDPERQLVLGAWHMGAVYRLGGIVARAALGASKTAGLAALDRAVSLGDGRAFFTGLSALLRLQQNPADPRGRALAEAAAHAAAPTALDRQLQRAAQAVLVPLRAGDKGAARKLAARLLPFGKLDK